MHYTPEKEKLHMRIVDAVSNVAKRHRLTPRTCVLIPDEAGRNYVEINDIEYDGEKIWVSGMGLVEVRAVTLTELADRLLEKYPGTSLLCGAEAAEELARYSLSFRIREGHRLLVRPKGFLEVYNR